MQLQHHLGPRLGQSQLNCIQQGSNLQHAQASIVANSLKSRLPL